MDNLVALVTGASKGIGQEIARQLADAGLSVYVGSRDAARGQRAAEEIGGDNAFLPALRRSAHPRIVNVSSGTGSLTWATDPRSRHWPGRYAAYRSSKTALNALTVFYARTLAGDGFKVNALDLTGPARLLAGWPVSGACHS